MKITIGEFEFTKEQAEKVYSELKEIFGAKKEDKWPLDQLPNPFLPYTPYNPPHDWEYRPETISWEAETSNEYTINKDDIQ